MIVQVGPYPEPLGGVSVYVKRMKEYLDSHGVANQVWDLSRNPKAGPDILATSMKSLVWRYFSRRDIEMIHYHLYTHRSKVVIGYLNQLFFKQRKKLLTIHGEARNMFDGIEARSLIRALNSFDAVICVREGDRNYLTEQGVTTALYEIPAFIAPQSQQPAASFPGYVTAFMQQHSFLITANASALRFHQDTDLYGLDLCIDLMARLKQRFGEQSLGFVFGLAEIRNYDYFHAQQERIRQLGLENDFLLLVEKFEFYPVIQSCQLFIRPTNTDGYPVSLAEAMYFKVPVIASDVAKRPEGTLLFANRNPESLFQVTEQVVLNYREYRERAARLEPPDNAESVFRLYRELLDSVK